MLSALENFYLDLLEDFPDYESGDVEAPTGYFTLTSLTAVDIPEKFHDLIGHEGTANIIVVQDNQGFVNGLVYETHREALEVFSAMETVYHEWLDADEDSV